MRHAIHPMPLLLVFGACAGAPARPTPADLEAELKAADVALDQSTRAHDAQAFAKLLCEGAAFGGRSFAVGKEAVLARWAPFLSGQDVTLTWAPEKAGASVAGELGWTTGSFQFRSAAGEAEQGRYATVWGREGGRICVAMDIGLEEPGALAGVAREPALRADRSAAGDLVAETGWLAEKAGTWLEVRRCSSAAACRTEVLSIVPAPPQKKEP